MELKLRHGVYDKKLSLICYAVRKKKGQMQLISSSKLQPRDDFHFVCFSTAAMM